MILKRLLQLGAASVLSLSSLLSIYLPTAHAAAATYTWTDAYSSTGGGSGCTSNCWSVPGNWDVGNTAATQPPANDDLLVFPSASGTTDDDMTGLVVGGMTFTGSYDVTGNPFVLDGNITVGSSSNTKISTNITLNTAVTINGNITGGSSNIINLENAVLNTNGNSLTISGTGDLEAYIGDQITGAGDISVGDISASDTTTAYLTNSSNSFSGNITIDSGGELSAQSSTLGAAGTITIDSGGTFSPTGTVTQDINMAGTGVNGSEGAIISGVTFSGTISLTGNTTVYSPNSMIFENLIPSGYTLSKYSGMTSQLSVTIPSSASSSQALTVNDQETYLVDGVMGDTTVNSGGTLKGNGTVGTLTLNNGGRTAPGHSPGCLTVSGDYNDAGVYQEDIQSPGNTACTDYSQLVVKGNVNLNGGSLDVNLLSNFSPSPGQTFDILKNESGSPINGAFSGLSEGAVFEVGTTKFEITYKGGTSGNDVVLTVAKPTATVTASASNTKAPGTPDTGFGLVAAHPRETLTASIIAAFSLVVIARRLKPVKR